MRTIALRLYGEKDLRLETFDLPPIGNDEILADIVSDSVCMSSYKAAIQGANHKRVPKDIATNPIIVGHEFCGTVLEVGKRWQGQFSKGQRYSIQPALNVPGRELEAPGYSFRTIGGTATHIVIPFFKASLAEPVSCIIGAFNSQYHYKVGEYVHNMGIAPGGTMAILAGAGPMGLGAIDYAISGPRQPRLLVVTDIDQSRLDRAASLYKPRQAAMRGVELHYLNTARDPVESLRTMNRGQGYDDVFVFAPVAALIEQGSRVLGFNGCLNFFAGPSKADFMAPINFYDVHYSGHHVVGSSGGNTDDLREALDLIGRNQIDPAVMITHVGGIDSAAETILHLPKIPGGKKLIYTGISMPLTAIEDFAKLGAGDPLFAELARLTGAANGLWTTDAEQYLLKHAKPIRLPPEGNAP
jgi:L-sorbose 1-phosphate reductase